jgi:hypothetical protein
VTAGDWPRTDDWRAMLAHLGDGVSRRKGTLYVCAGLRSLPDLPGGEPARRAIRVAERAADGAAVPAEIRAALGWAVAGTVAGTAGAATLTGLWPELARDDYPQYRLVLDPAEIRERAAEGDYWSEVKLLMEAGSYRPHPLPRTRAEAGRERALDNAISRRRGAGRPAPWLDERLVDRLGALPGWPGGALVREIFGDPFRGPPDLGRFSPDAAALAAALDRDGAYDRLPVLADALEEAGCTDAELLLHCRVPAAHVRGCWAVDAVFGRG